MCDGGDWPGWDAVHGLVDVGPRTYLTQWSNHRADESREFRVAMGALAAANCDRLRVAWLLTALQGNQQWENISRPTLRRCADELATAAHAIRRLFFSQARLALGLDSLQFAASLRSLAMRATDLAPQIDERRPIGRDICRATLVRYVLQATGQQNDKHVAALIASVEADADVDANAQPQPYTTEAHIAWRRRGAVQGLLNGSAAVLELEAAMEQDLREN